MVSKFDINPATGKQYGVNPASGNQDDNYWASIEKTLPGYAEEKAAQALSKQKADTAALNAAQEAKQNDFLARFREAIGAQETLPDMATRIGESLGLPALQSTAQTAIQQVAALPETEKNATRGFSVNANQLSQIINSKLSELSPIAQQAVTQEQAAESNLSTQLGYGVAQQNKELTPYTSEQSLLSDQLAREYSGFTTDKENELKVLMQQISNNQALTTQQLNNANSLALAKIQYDSTKKDTNNLLTLSAGETVYDTSTNQALYTSPYKPLTGSSSSGWGED